MPKPPTPPDDPSPASRSRWFGRREPAPSDSVIIDDEDNHAWWSQRDDLTRLQTHKKHGRAATAQPAEPDAAFAPAEAKPDVALRERWDLDSLYEWGAAPVDDDATTVDDHQSSPTAWKVLGLTPDASWLEVVRQHRTLAKSHHPDLQSHTDLTERRVAELKMAEINAAFDSLGSIYGMGKGA